MSPRRRFRDPLPEGRRDGLIARLRRAEASFRFGERSEKDKVSRAEICRYYLDLVERAKTIDQLARVSLEEVHLHLREGGYSRRLDQQVIANLRQALADVNRAIAAAWVSLRTNGQLVVKPEHDEQDDLDELIKPKPVPASHLRKLKAIVSLGGNAVTDPWFFED